MVSFVFAMVISCSGDDESTPSVVEGRKLYASNGCVLCHGRDGRGDGPMAENFRPRPRDFRDLSGYKQGRDIADMAKTIEMGTRMDGGKMPGYPHISPADREKIAAYVVSLQGED